MDVWRVAAERASASLWLAPRDTGSLAVAWANAALLELLGAVPEDVLGCALSEIREHGEPIAVPGLVEPAGFPDVADDGSPDPASGQGPAPLPAELDPEWFDSTITDILPGEEMAGRIGAVPEQRAIGAQTWRVVTARLIVEGGGEAGGTVTRLDGDLPVWVRVIPIRGASDPSPCLPEGGWLVTLSPCTDELQEAYSEVQEAEHQFLALAQHAPIGIFLSDAGARLGFVNARFAEIANEDPEHLLGTGWLDLIHPQDMPQLYEILQTVLSGSAAEQTLRIAPVADAVRWVELRLAPVATARRGSGFIGIAEDVTARRALQEQLSYQAKRDALTGLINRRYLIETLNEWLGSRRARDREFAVLFCDLDGFKQVNDTMGHEAGDRVLVEVARRLVRTARDYDVVARAAGDEFVILLRYVVGTEDASAAAARQLAGLCEPFRVMGREVPISASVGVALPDDGDTAETILRRADRGMYAAKAAGPGQWRFGIRELPGSLSIEDGEPDAGVPEEPEVTAAREHPGHPSAGNHPSSDDHPSDGTPDTPGSPDTPGTHGAHGSSGSHGADKNGGEPR